MSEVIDDQIDSLCDEYEKQKTSGTDPDLSEFLERVEDSSRGDLLYWLMRMERQWCHDDPLSLKNITEKFRREFPQFSTVIEKVFPESKKEGLLPRIEGYRIESFINQGGQGSVYRAIQIRTGQRVAIKLVDVSFSERNSDKKSKAIEFLRNEIRVLSALQHPNVVKIFDAGECSEGFYYVMQLVEGGSLADRIQSISQVDAADYIKQIAGAVESANKLGILHLDIKPSNILFDENSNQPLLTDFGLSQFVVNNQEDVKAVGGTPDFMAPEQQKGETVDNRTDIYGLGATLLTLIHGDPKAIQTLKSSREQNGLIQPERRVGQANPRLNEICHKCLKPDPKDRYQNFSEFSNDLDRFAVREDARRVAQMGNRSILTSPFYLVSNLLVTIILYRQWETQSIGLEILTWVIVFSMYGGVFFTLSSVTNGKQNAEELVALESLYTLWTAKMLAAITIVVTIRIFLSRIDGIEPATSTILLSYPMFSALTGTIVAAMAPRFWKQLYFVSACWWLFSIVIICIETFEDYAFLVPVIYGTAGLITSILWGLQLKKFARENSAPTELMNVARTIEY